MMTEKRKHYTAAFTREAVRLVSEQGDSMSKRPEAWTAISIG
jgi:transposase-like protein